MTKQKTPASLVLQGFEMFESVTQLGSGGGNMCNSPFDIF
jgi:hypothetical protein